MVKIQRSSGMEGSFLGNVCACFSGKQVPTRKIKDDDVPKDAVVREDDDVPKDAVVPEGDDVPEDDVVPEDGDVPDFYALPEMGYDTIPDWGRKGPNNRMLSGFLGEGIDGRVRRFTLNELEIATDGFSSDNIFHSRHVYDCFSVYVGVLTVPETKKVLVKKFDMCDISCPRKELWFLSKLRHPNILKIIGFCNEGDGYLVTEFMENGSLEERLYVEDTSGRARVLSWQQRTKIMMGVAQALVFFHGRKFPVIFSGLVPSRIYLDSDFNPKLSCFTPAATQTIDWSDYCRISGRHEEYYSAPEISTCAQLAPWNDVHSYGLLVLKLLSGRQGSWLDKQGVSVELSRWACSLMEKYFCEVECHLKKKRLCSAAIYFGLAARMVDPKLEVMSYREVRQFDELAMLAKTGCFVIPRKRDDMPTVVGRLEKYLGS